MTWHKRVNHFSQLDIYEMQSLLMDLGNNHLQSVENLSSGPPRVSEKVVHRQTVRIGRTMKLQCPVEGDPPPLIMWSKDGRNIHSGWMRFRVTHQALRIKDVEAEDAGTFNCKATNGFGSVNINYTLIVIGEFRFFFFLVCVCVKAVRRYKTKIFSKKKF